MPDGTADHFNGVAVPKLKFPINSMLVFRGNKMASNSGIRIERQAEDVVVEGNVAQESDAPVEVTADCERVFVSPRQT